MKIVIDINEKDYKFIKSVRSIMKNSDTFQRITTDIFFAVKEGTPIIDNAPSVEPEITNDDLQAAMTESYHLGYELAETKFKRPQGEWIFRQDPIYGGYYKCSECGEVEKAEKNFCSNCGADMRNKGE